jgi:hypothetical protein
MMDLSSYSNTIQIIANAVTAVGLPLAIVTFILQKVKENRMEEEKTFHQLDESYIEFMKICLSNSDLDIFGTAIKEKYEPTEEQLRREQAIFGILISLFERAHVMFRDKSSDFRQDQWHGWIEYIKFYSNRQNFIREWNKIGYQFDRLLYKFMQEIISESKEANKRLQADQFSTSAPN